MTLLSRGLAWVQEAMAALRAREEAVAEKYRAKPAPPERPRPPAVITNRRRRRIALITAVNDYGGRGNLRGCLTDAKRWGYLYRLAGWEVTTLLDRETAGDSITALLSEMAGGLEPGDSLAWVCSSHGTRIPDLDDPTGEVSAVLPADVNDHASPEWFAARCVTHRETAAIVREMPDGARFSATIDACFSGVPPTSLISARALGAVTAPLWLPRFMPPPAGLMAAPRHVVPLMAPRDSVPVPGMRSLLLSACAPNETAADAFIAGEWCGAFSKHCIDAANRIRGGEVAAIVESARRTLRRDGFEQTPWVHGDPVRLTEPAPWHVGS